MKKKAIYIFITILATLFLSVILFKKNENNCFNERINQKNIDVEHFNKLILSNVFKNELVQVNNCLLIFQKDSVELLDIVSQDNFSKLVFRASEDNCSICVNHIVDKLKEHFSKYASNSNIIVIYDSDKMRYSEGICEKQAFITNQRDILGLPAENINIPFLFILDKNMVAKMVFIPDKGMPKLTDEYLNVIKNRFFTQQRNSK